MKVRIRKTDEIVNAANYATVTLNYCDSYGNPIKCKLDDIELLQEPTDNIDWEQRRYELAKAAMQGILSNSELNSWTEMDSAKYAVACADALIEKLKEK